MEKNEELLIHPFSDQGFARLVELSETTYHGREISDQVYLGWEYIQNPDGLALITTGEIERKIVSQYIILPRSFSVDNKILKGSVSVNTLTHPHYRGKGLFEKLANETFDRCKEKEILFTIGFPNPISHPFIERKQIFETIGYLPLLFRPLNPIRLLIRYIKNKRDKTGNEIELNITDQILSANAEISFFDFKTDSDKYEIFLQKFNKEKQNVTMRSLQFLRWRYVNIPNRKYHLIKLEIGNEIKAIAVFRSKYMFGLRSGILIDLISHINLKEIKYLLDTLHKIAIKNKLDLIFATLPANSFEFKILKNSGFYLMPQFFLPQKLPFIVKRQLPSCPEHVTDFRKWFLTFGDYDIL